MRWSLPGSLVLLVLLAGCGGSSETKALNPNLVFTVDTTSADRFVRTADPAGRKVYGVNRLVGSATVDGHTVEVETLGTVNYLDGNGPIGGFLTVTFDDGSAIAFVVKGTSVSDPDTTNAVFNADLELIGGKGRYDRPFGRGRFRGERRSELGGAVRFDVQIEVSARAGAG
ncbi:MAG: hypothetical protein KIS66_07745 [Fimbriimonadaceae bacterium]|nr:hypothetical protein [Fimbriimonadaceae bacterium]